MHTSFKNQISGKHLLCLIAFCASLVGSPRIFAAEPEAPQPETPKPEVAKPEVAKPKVAPKPQAAPKAKTPPKTPAAPPAQPGSLAEFLNRFDLDKTKTINVDESIKIQDAYRDNPQDPMLVKYDTNKDGKLSDDEIMKITPAKAPAAKPKPKPAPAPAPKNPKKK